ncbi:hypothetical protein [Acinetobacter johnsonii]|uniref:hypothetical protein n=1 Tax=Acinetobacter johnsonii TaxID=40214 RepID=UPI001F38E400|nr:hypothetical protein [Acinetobacter johnsonii]
MAVWLNSIRVLLNVHNQVGVTSSLTTMLANALAYCPSVVWGTAVKWKTPVDCKQLGGIKV